MPMSLLNWAPLFSILNSSGKYTADPWAHSIVFSGMALNDYAEHQQYLKDGSFSHLKEITDLLDEANEAVLMLWDGLDKPLGQAIYSVGLANPFWDFRTILATALQTSRTSETAHWIW